jgi:putative ABC transport system permease protein
VSESLPALSLMQIALCLIPAVIVVWILWRWSLGAGEATYGLLRMLAQLLLAGYALNYVFAANDAGVTAAVLVLMFLFAVWIALRPLPRRSGGLFIVVSAAMIAGAVSTLLFVLIGVLGAAPLNTPQLLLPLAGMAFANAMNTCSLGLERFFGEIARGESERSARGISYRAAMIPTINSLFATGIVSLPGTMTGQIMSGISPHVAARYQILVIGLLFGASGISAACCLMWAPATSVSASVPSQR